MPVEVVEPTPLTKAQRLLIRQLLATHSVSRVVETINANTRSEVSYGQVDAVRRSMASQGAVIAPRDKQTPSRGPFLKPDTPHQDDPAARQRLSHDALACRRLHERMVAYFERRGKEMCMDWADAAVRILNAPETLRCF